MRDADLQAVIFDFDGLLMDTESTMLRSWQWEWTQWGLTLDVDRFLVNHGGDVTEERYAALAAAVGPGFDRAASHERRMAYRDKLHETLDLAAGIREWLDEARGMGLRVAVASSSTVEWLTGHLGRAGVLDWFEILAGGNEVTRHKPAPDVYELALRRLGLPADAAVAVEDTPHGVTAAQAAGLRCISIPNPFVPPERVSHADLVLSSAGECTLKAALAAVTGGGR